MSKPFTLQPLMELARNENESASRKLGELNRQQQSAEEKLVMLQEFRRDYQTRLQAATQQGMDPVSLRNYQEFIYKLDEAIRQQTRNVENSKASTQTGRQVFTQSLRKVRSYDTLHQRHLENERMREEKQEQKMMDEHTGRAAALNMMKQRQK